MTRSSDIAPAWDRGALRVLVVDDEPDVRLGLRLLAESIQAEVRDAESGERALEICGGWVPHLVLSDIAMKGMSGVELLAALSRNHPETRVVLITGFGTIELAGTSLHGPVDGVFGHTLGFGFIHGNTQRRIGIEVRTTGFRCNHYFTN